MRGRGGTTNMAALRAIRTWIKGSCRPAARGRLRVSPAAPLCSSGTDPRGGPRPGGTQEDPEYIPRRKARNPMTRVAYAWMIGLPSGVIGFILVKRQVDRNRLAQLKVRQRMARANEGGAQHRLAVEGVGADH
ncbi:DUF4748 domain-containing protein [Antennarius striatus]|uniref:DUF4748 domain-containing protein n=1 Tax=Antennarius striatus TaxID=241820 RepID=UPI0035AE7BD2